MSCVEQDCLIERGIVLPFGAISSPVRFKEPQVVSPRGIFELDFDIKYEVFRQIGYSSNKDTELLISLVYVGKQPPVIGKNVGCKRLCMAH